MSCANCSCCKGILEYYMKDPLKCTTSAASNGPESLKDLRAIVLNGSHTPPKLAKATLAMFVAHLSAGDQSAFNPTGPLPASLRQYEDKAFLSMAGISTLFNGYALSTGHYSSGPVQELVADWPKIRKWIHHFLHRALTRKVAPSMAPITSDEKHFIPMGEDWDVCTIGSVIFNIFLGAAQPYFQTVLANDGSFTFIMRLWARQTRRLPKPSQYLPCYTMLFHAVLLLAISKDNKHGVQAELVREVDGNTDNVATFVMLPIRSAAMQNPSLSIVEADDQIITPSIMLLDMLLGGMMGGVDEKPSVLGPAFLNNPEMDPRPPIISILTKYSGLCKDLGPRVPHSLQSIISASFEVCSTLLWYEGSITFAVQLLDGGLLDAYANIARSINSFSQHDISMAAALLEQNIATFLSHDIVISAAKNALHRLEEERKSEYDALSQTSSRLSDAWKYFKGHAFERATLRGIYDAKFRKEDKLSCDSCHIRMNEKKLSKCAGCKSQHYCSKECQVKSWKEHKKECKFLAKNLEVYKIKADISHFVEFLARTDIRRHLPGLNALAQRNPRTRAAGSVLAYRADYHTAPPVFDVFPASDFADSRKYVEEGILMHAPSQEMARQMYETVRSSNGVLRIVEVHMRGYARTPAISMYIIGADDFHCCHEAVPATFNPERPRAVDEKGKTLAIQWDSLDIVMADAIYGRTLSQSEFNLYATDCVHLGSENQEKTVFERVDGAVKRRQDRDLEPCCHDQTGHSI